jgi:hypothetical protein
MRLATVLLALALTASGSSAQQANSDPVEQVPPIHADPALDRLTANRLETFQSQDAYEAYWRQITAYNVERRKRIENMRLQLRSKAGAKSLSDAARVALIERQRRSERAGARAQDGYEDVCNDPDCYAEEDNNEQIVVTASRVGGSNASAAPSRASRAPRSGGAPNITNVQTAGVDEGDIVKQIGDYLAVLQDGRIFVVDTSDGGLALTDRTNVYVHRSDGAWYDEMLVEGSRIIVTAYSYGNQATEITVFRLDQTKGKLIREGRFFLNSYDYYSGENYASRIIGDNLVLYTVYAVNQLAGRSTIPKLWRWTEEGERLRTDGKPAPETRRQGRALIDPETVYRPLLRTSWPFVHVVTICPLATYRPGGVPECRVSSFVGPAEREFFVSTEAVYLWVGQQRWGWDVPTRSEDKRCEASPNHASMPPAVVYRVPVDGGKVGVVGVRGQPIDQFSMDMTKNTFRLFSRWNQPGCSGRGTISSYRFTNVPLRKFARDLIDIPDSQHVPAPAPGPGAMENRFADDWFVYGGRSQHYEVASEPGKAGRPLFILPVERPDKAERVDLPHNIIRLERVGADRIAASGYRLGSGLDLSLVQLGKKSWRTDTAYLHGRFESEGRSHAFNSLIEEDRSGLVGIPTVERKGRGGRYVWNSQGSDVSFLKVTSGGRLSNAGALEQGQIRPASGYRCEVSCIDWYGNSRPIFTDGRIFALMATEIAEGRMAQNGIREVQRLNLTGGVERLPQRR